MAKLAVVAWSCLVPLILQTRIIITTLIKNAYLVVKTYNARLISLR
jgi:hypothetical protein